MINYFNKYIKYKKKYNNYKNQLGASSSSPNPYGRLFFNYSLFDLNMSSYKDHITSKRFNALNMIEFGDAAPYNQKNNLEMDFDSNYSKWIVWLKVLYKTTIIYKNYNDEELYKYETKKGNKFILFATEALNQSTLILELIEKFNDDFNEISEWNNDNKPNFQELYSTSNISFIQKIRLPSKSKVCIIGDVHSSLHSVLNILIEIKDDYFENDEDMILKENRFLIFLGDIIDRGPYSMELLCLVFGLKNNNFDKVFIINGNHEEYSMYRTFINPINHKPQIGLEYEYINQTQSENEFESIQDSSINEVLFMLPSCIYLEVNDKFYHLSHGAFEPEVSNISINSSDEVRKKFKSEDPNRSELNSFLTSDKTFHLISYWLHEEKDPNNYKWGDFDDTVDRIDLNIERSGPDPNTNIYKFGIEATKEYIKKNNIISLITGHQDKEPLGLLLDNDKEISSTRYIRSTNYNLYNLNLNNIDHNEATQYFEEFDKLIFDEDGNSKKNISRDDKKRIYELLNLKAKNFKIELDPTEFLALTTSTATQSKFLPYILKDKVYLELRIP